jgi:isoleucyl-tRNA synthetase
LEYPPTYTSQSVYAAFPVLNLPSHLKEKLANYEKNLRLLVWTTTPWTLPANQAICVGSEMEYQVVADGRGNWLLAAVSQLEEMRKLFELPLEPQLTSALQGRELAGIEYEQILWHVSRFHYELI